MANDKDWERRSDEWVKSMHESRIRKENGIKKHRNNDAKKRDLQKGSEDKSKDFH